MSQEGRRKTSRGVLLGVVALVVGTLGMLVSAQTDGGATDGGATDAGLDGGPQGTILDFHTMTPVSGPFVGSANPVLGVPGDVLPWTIAHGDGTLRADGELEVSVTGLVLPTDPAVPANQQGTNPSATFTVIVSCQTTGATGVPTQTNVTSPPATATPTGNAQIRAKLTLPNPCLAPVLFVAGANGLWFAVTGTPPPTASADGGTADAGGTGGDAGTESDAGTGGGGY